MLNMFIDLTYRYVLISSKFSDAIIWCSLVLLMSTAPRVKCRATQSVFCIRGFFFFISVDSAKGSKKIFENKNIPEKPQQAKLELIRSRFLIS